MVGAIDCYQAGRLGDAIAASVEQVKNNPGDVAARWLLCELLCFGGELERADKHLDLIAKQDPRAMASAALFRQLIRAETARCEFWTRGRVPQFLGEPSDELKFRLQATIRAREGKLQEAADLLERAEALRGSRRVVCGGKSFDDFRDVDDLTASIFEVLTSTGKYYWVPMERVRVVEMRPPARTRDLLWRQAAMTVEGGPDGEVYLPALYPHSHASGEDQVRLGRVTRWADEDSALPRGLGQRMYLLGCDAIGIGDLKRLECVESGR